ncbi:MAG: glycosyltransferase [Candidatus Egerieousia sp.]|nr:glycosyltransferase [Candidatus Egerieousia sp.]
MPTLLQLNITANWGSTGKIAEQIGVVAQNNGWESYIAYGGFCNLSRNKLIRIGCKASRYLHYAEQRVLDNEGQCSRVETRKLIKQIDEIKPDIINLHNIHDHYLNFRILFEYLNRTDIKVVWTFHDCWAITGHCMHFVTKNCERWKTWCHDCPMKGEYPKSFLDCSKRNWKLKKSLFAGNRNLTIVACSDWIAGFARESFLKDKRIEVIHNGCDIDVFSPQPTPQSDKFRIIAVSNVWYRNKGEDDIYKLRQMLPLQEYEIFMVGLSSEQVRNLPDGITGIQRTQNVQELAQLYSIADVLINPTYEDNFPTVNIESLACGTPIITYRTGGSPEAVDELTGAVIEQGNLNGLCEKIKEFKRLKFKQVHTGDCRMRAMEKFDKNKCFEKYIDLYESILSE